MSFELSQGQWAKYHKWKQEQDKKVRESQKGSEYEHYGLPYYGAIGGAYTFCFTPTSIGMCVSVENGSTGEKLDLTDDF